MINDKYLDVVIEECAEVIQAITKIKRFGIYDWHPDYDNGNPNWQRLVTEIGDLLACIDKLELPETMLANAQDAKRHKLAIYGPEGSYVKEKNSATDT